MAKYFIQNQNSVEGCLIGSFTRLDHLYYKNHEETEDDGVHVEWTNILADAKAFKTEHEAWDLARRLWGLWFANSTKTVISAHDEMIASSERNRERYR